MTAEWINKGKQIASMNSLVNRFHIIIVKLTVHKVLQFFPCSSLQERKLTLLSNHCVFSPFRSTTIITTTIPPPTTLTVAATIKLLTKLSYHDLSITLQPSIDLIIAERHVVADVVELSFHQSICVSSPHHEDDTEHYGWTRHGEYSCKVYFMLFFSNLIYVTPAPMVRHFEALQIDLESHTLQKKLLATNVIFNHG